MSQGIPKLIREKSPDGSPHPLTTPRCEESLPWSPAFGSFAHSEGDRLRQGSDLVTEYAQPGLRLKREHASAPNGRPMAQAEMEVL